MSDRTGFRPLDDKLLVRLPDEEEKDGAIYLPQGMEKPVVRGEVVAAGPGLLVEDQCGSRHPMSVVAGDEVMFQDYAGVPIELHGQKMRIVREADLLGVVV